MREQVRDKGRIEHMLESIDNLFEFTKGKTFEQFQADKILKFAVIKNIEIIGEAAYKTTNELRDLHQEIEWKDIIGMRHVMVHDYYQISDKEAWLVIKNDLQPLKEKLEVILKTL